MFRAMPLQSWYNLSDPKLKQQLARDLSFRRFVGLGLADSVPDHSAMWHLQNKNNQLSKQNQEAKNDFS